jgi:hypothetical protein
LTKWAQAVVGRHAGEDCIVIRVPFSVLPDALKQNPRDDSYYDVTVNDVSDFAQDVIRALNREEEDGTTPVHELLDKALASAIDDGSTACEYRKAKR